MTSGKRQKFKVFILTAAICLSLTSYVALRFLETKSGELSEQQILAEDRDSDALPDVRLIKKLMHKTLEFMLYAPRL